MRGFIKIFDASGWILSREAGTIKNGSVGPQDCINFNFDESSQLNPHLQPNQLKMSSSKIKQFC